MTLSFSVYIAQDITIKEVYITQEIPKDAYITQEIAKDVYISQE